MATMTQRGVEGVSSSVGRCHRVPMHCYRLEDAKEKKFTVNIYWVPGVNHLGSHSRSAFAEFTDVSAMQEDFTKKVEAEFERLIGAATHGASL